MMRAGGALGQFPFIAEQIFGKSCCSTGSASWVQVTSRPLVIESPAIAGGVVCSTTPSPGLDTGAFRLGANQAASARAMRLAEVWPPAMSRDGFLVVHRHAGESFADVPRRADRGRLAVRSFGIHIDQASAQGERGAQVHGRRCSAFVTSQFVLGAQWIALRVPSVGAPAPESERLEAIDFQGEHCR